MLGRGKYDSGSRLVVALEFRMIAQTKCFPKVFFFSRDGGFESVMDMSVEFKVCKMIADINPCKRRCIAWDI